MLEFVGRNLIPCQNHEIVLIINYCKSWVFPKFCIEWGHLELTMDIVRVVDHCKVKWFTFCVINLISTNILCLNAYGDLILNTSKDDSF
jgi:hypothetical protein